MKYLNIEYRLEALLTCRIIADIGERAIPKNNSFLRL